MKSGMFPGQLEALRELARQGLKYEGVARRQRRMFLGFCFGTAAVGAGAFIAGRGMAARGAHAAAKDPATIDAVLLEKRAQLRRLAVASDEELYAARPLFLIGLDAMRDDTLLWCGFARLARMATAGKDRALALRLMKTATAGPTPEFVTETIAPLTAVSR